MLLLIFLRTFINQFSYSIAGRIDLRPRSAIQATCQNHRCSHFKKEKGKDIIKRGKNHAGNQQYLCHHCGKIFLETTNTLFFYKHLSEGEIYSILNLLVEKNGIRSISRMTGHHRDSISNLLEDIALNAEEVNNYLFSTLKKTYPNHADFWMTVKNNRQKFSSDALKNLDKMMRKFIGGGKILCDTKDNCP